MDKQLRLTEKKYPYYRAIDINGDGVKELFLSTTMSSLYSYGDSIVILTYRNNKIIPLLYFSSAGGGHISYKNKFLCHYHRLADNDWHDIYELKNGELKKIVSVNRFHGFWGMDGVYIEKFSKENKTCSRTTYNNLIKKYYTGGNKITYSIIQTSAYKKIIKLLVNKKWYPARGSLANIYHTFTNTEYRTYNKITKKLIKSSKIQSITKNGNEYRLTTGNGQIQYKFNIVNNRIQQMNYYEYSSGKWNYCGGNALTLTDYFPNGLIY